MAIVLKPVRIPDFGALGDQPEIAGSIYADRADRAYAAAGADWLAVYGDREHFGNIVFLTGFEPRFEEAFLLLGPAGRRVVITGNESESYAQLAGLPGVEVLRSQTLSLMGQDRTQFPRLADRLTDAGLKAGDSVGLVGWKYLEPEEDADYATSYFVPAAYVQMFARLVGRGGRLLDATAVLMHPETGLRTVIDVDQIAAFEWAATRCSRAVWTIVSGARPGDQEYEAVARASYGGDPLNVHTMFASSSPGEPLVGLRSPTGRRIRQGEGVTTAIGYWGALASRAGLLATENDGFLEVSKAYFTGLLAWYAAADIGVAGGDLHNAVAEALGAGGLRSTLNPGHLTGHEEWMHTPVRPGSTERLRSGMPFQVDIIPTPVPQGQALNCEDPVTFADAALRAELARRHPETHARIEARRAFIKDALGVALKPSILPLSDTPLCLPPFWLKSDHLLALD